MRKQILITALTVFALASGVKAGSPQLADQENNQVETSWFTAGGERVIAFYDLEFHVVYLFLPDGRRYDIKYDPEVTFEKMDRGLRKLAEKELASK